MKAAVDLFSYRPFWARRFGIAPFLPRSREEMETLGWDSCDVVIVTGDAYVDHPAFGAALIGRLLEAQGFRVGVLAQPEWTNSRGFTALGKPNLFFGVTAGNMDSLVNQFTSDKKPRGDDAYTPNAEPRRRPSRACIVYCQRCRQAYPDVPIIIGGIEASLRRIAHYDYWSDSVRRSILLDAGADLLAYGNAERQVVEIAHRLARGQTVNSITDVRGTAYAVHCLPEGFTEIDRTRPDDVYPIIRDRRPWPLQKTRIDRSRSVIRIPSYESVRRDPALFAYASRISHLESNPGNALALVQRHGRADVWINPPPTPLTTKELDAVYELPFARLPHPGYAGARIPAYEMIKYSITIERGCFGGCSFCSITEHEGRIVQSRSADSVVAEIERVRDTTPGFTGQITDLGGPTANMYCLGCKSRELEAACRRSSCLYPGVCKNLRADHAELIALYRRARQIKGVKKITIGSGVRYDLAVISPKYVEELVRHHVGGYLKIAPEHVSKGPLSLMLKPGIEAYYRFKELFDRASKEAGKEQYLVPYFIAAHPGTTDRDMLELALWLKKNDYRLDQVQVFLPSPMASATTMYYTGQNPYKMPSARGDEITSAKSLKQRRLHKAFLRWHDPDNWPLLREALERMGRRELIGGRAGQLVPSRQPAGWRPKSPSKNRPAVVHPIFRPSSSRSDSSKSSN
jgi:uncharacterized radical SAM protein YgiQ